MTKYRLGTVVFCAVVISGCADRETELTVVSALGKTNPKSIEDRQAACLSDSRISLGLVSLDVCVGADLFFREAFGGNGRTCGTCHPAEHNFTIDPTFIASLPSTDPLFVAENSPDLTGLERPALMRQFGLILENVDGAEDPTNKFVMRSVPHTFALHTSVTAPGLPTPDGTTLPPLDRTGWSGDGAPGNGQLRDFQTGAVFQHYTKSLQRVSGVDFRPPTSAELDSILAFLGSVGRMNEIDLTGVSLTDSRAETGRITYIGARCNGCHRNAGANNGAGINRNFDTGIEHARVAALDDPSGPKIPRDGGFGGQGLPAFNHDADGDGILDSYGNGTFNTPPLIEAADTGPFFHTNAFNTIEDAVTFYTTATFANSPAGGGNAVPFTPTDITNVGRFLRVLNASMNCQLALYRIDALLQIIPNENNNNQSNRDKQHTLARLALAEVNDALSVLSAVSELGSTAQSSLVTAQAALQDAATDNSPTHRTNDATSARLAVQRADVSLGTGMVFVMGQGSLMF